MRRRALFAALALAALGLGLAWQARGPGIDQLPAAPGTLPDDALRITVLGTSLSAGQPWPGALSDALAACLGRPVPVTVVAAGGRTILWGEGQARAVRDSAPDLVLVEFTANDSDLRRGVWPGDSRARHAALTGALLEGAPLRRVLLINPSPVFGLRRAARPLLGAYLRGYADLARARPEIGYLDLVPAWAAALEGRDRRAGFPDGLHPDPDLAARVQVPVLRDAVLALYGADPAACP